MTIFLGKAVDPEQLSKLAQSNTTSKVVPPGFKTRKFDSQLENHNRPVYYTTF